MNKIGIFLLSAIALIMVSCGGSKYDNDRLMELYKQFDKSDSFTDDEWKEFDKLFAAGVEEWGKTAEGLYDKVKPGMTWEEADNIYNTEFKNFSALKYASNIAYYVRKDEAHANVVKTDEMLDDIRDKFRDMVREKLGPRPEEDYYEVSEEVEEESEPTAEFILTQEGFGPFTLGMDKSEVQASIPGMYDAKEYHAFDHEGADMDISGNIHGWMQFTLNGEKRFAITFNNKGKAIQISVQSPEIPTELGITTGSPLEVVPTLPGAQPIEDVFIDGWDVNGFTIYTGDGISSIAIGEAY